MARQGNVATLTLHSILLTLLSSNDHLLHSTSLSNWMDGSVCVFIAHISQRHDLPYSYGQSTAGVIGS